LSKDNRQSTEFGRYIKKLKLTDCCDSTPVNEHFQHKSSEVE